MSDIGTCSEDNWVALWLDMVFVNEQCQVVHFVEKGDPDITRDVVVRDFLRRVVPAQFVRPGDVLGFFHAGGS